MCCSLISTECKSFPRDAFPNFSQKWWHKSLQWLGQTHKEPQEAWHCQKVWTLRLFCFEDGQTLPSRSEGGSRFCTLPSQHTIHRSQHQPWQIPLQKEKLGYEEQTRDKIFSPHIWHFTCKLQTSSLGDWIYKTLSSLCVQKFLLRSRRDAVIYTFWSLLPKGAKLGTQERDVSYKIKQEACCNAKNQIPSHKTLLMAPFLLLALCCRCQTLKGCWDSTLLRIGIPQIES